MFRFALLIGLLFPAAGCADEPKELLDKARDAYQQRKYDDALKLVQTAIAAAPKNPEAYFLRANIFMQQREFDKAVDDLTRTTELAPEFAPAYDLRGTAHFKLAKIKESLEDFDRAIKIRPEVGPAHWRRGLTLYYAEKFADGVAQFTTSDKEEPNDVENAVWHFLCNARVQGIEKARPEFLKVKQDPRGEYMMKIYQMFKGDAKPEDVFAAAEAGKISDELRNEQRFYANYYVGMFLEATGKPKESLAYLKKAVEKHPIGHYMMDVARVHIKLREK